MDLDEELIKQALAGDDDAFKKIVDIYKGYVFAIILNFIKDYNEVENIAQEVFLQIHTSLPKYKNDNFKGWIGRIAANKSIDWKRKKSRKFKEETLENIDYIVDREEAKTYITPEDTLIQKEKRERINNVCDKLPKI